MRAQGTVPLFLLLGAGGIKAQVLDAKSDAAVKRLIAQFDSTSSSAGKLDRARSVRMRDAMTPRSHH